MVSKMDGVKRYTLFYGVHRDGARFLWAVSAVSTDLWSRTARQIAIKAMKEWTRLVSDPVKGKYIGRTFPGLDEVPDFGPDKTLEELWVEAFGDGHIIDSTDHPIYQELFCKK
jgi:hypothetical protein